MTFKQIFRSTWVMIALLSLLFSWLCVRTSAKIGHLNNVPQYDDVVYFLSAADGLHSLREGGLSGLIEFAKRDHLHSPYSTLIAAMGFAVEGIRFAAPYRFNAILIAAYLAGVAYFFRKTEFLPRLLAMIFFLTPPFATMAVVEFRPDMAWATAIGFTAVFGMTRADLFHRTKIAAIFGALTGVALLVKPSTFVMTLAVSLMSFGFAWFLELSRNSFGEAVRRLLPTALVALAAMVLVAGPYYAAFGEIIKNYFVESVFGENAGVWAYPGDWKVQWLFYIHGGGSNSNLGRQTLIILAAWLVLVALRVRNGSRQDRLQTLFLGLSALFIYCANSMLAMKTAFVGGAFYGTLFFSLAFLGGEFFASVPKWTRIPHRDAVTALAFATLAAVCIYEWPEYSRDKRNKSYRVAQSAVTEFLKDRQTPKKIVLAQAGPIIHENLTLFYLARKEKVCPSMYSAAFSRSVEEFEGAIQNAEMVVAQDTDTAGSSEALPSADLQDQFVALMQSRQDFQLAKCIPIPGKDFQWRNIYLFVRNGACERRSASASATPAHK